MLELPANSQEKVKVQVILVEAHLSIVGVMGLVDDELSEIKRRIREISQTELIACHPSMVQIKVR